MKTSLTISFLFLILPILTMAQTLHAYEKAADEAYEKEDYYNAVYYYELVLKSKEKPGIYYKYAEACRHSFAYRKAEEAYKKVVEHKDRDRYDKVDFYYALTLKHNGKYDEAAAAFQKFLTTAAANDYYKAKAEQELASCSLAKSLADKPVDSIKIERLGDNINTEYSDFGAHEVKAGQIYYSSLRFERKPDANANKKEPKRLISKLLDAKNLENRGNNIPIINSTEMHSANSCLSADGQRLYFTKCSGDRSDSVRCQIYYSKIQPNGNWSKPYKLPAPLNLEGYSVSHPQVVVDNGQEWIYFSSDRPGTEGAMDIWRAKMLSDSLTGQPENLGKTINTIENEVTPFFHANTQTLYFASQWHQGMGGYDIFHASLQANKWQKPVNMGTPINSAANDLYWVFSQDDSTGYFASNRSGSMTITEESCCNDIYKFAYSKNIRLIPPSIDTPLTDTNLITQIDTPKTADGGGIDKKIEELNSMLPLKLYFHNDEPDSNTTVAFTDKPYQLPYDHYITLQEDYVREHAGQFDVEKQILVTKKINDFFDLEVKGEYARMNAFFKAILGLLEAGISLEVQIKGYTSPRSYEGYNVQLAHRRITSVRKQFFIYENGIFIKFFQKGLLTVTELPLGESTAPKGISDAFNDPKNSIYSVEASKERRAEIVILQRN